MPKLNLIGPQMFGADAAEANKGILEIINGYVENLSGEPCIKTRPGLRPFKTFDNTNARVDLYWWEAGRTLLAVCGGQLFALTSATGNWSDITPVASADKILGYNTPAMFAADEHGVHISTGLGILWWDGSASTATRVTDSNLPSQITGLTYLKGYFIVSELNTQRFYYATYGPTDPRTAPPNWSAFFLDASTSPDDIITLQAGWEELFVLGRESAESQFVTGDSTVPFRTLSGSSIETGVVNRTVLQKMLNTWIYLNPNKQVVILEGRTPKVISKPIELALYSLEFYEDVTAFKLYERFYILNFYTDQKTFVFDTETNLWYRWETWDNDKKRYQKFLGASGAQAKSWGGHYVGGFDGKVYQVVKNYQSDGSVFIRMKILTAVIDHNTPDEKRCRELHLRLKRGEG